MDIGSIFLFLALLVVVALFVARPLNSAEEPTTLRQSTQAEAEYEAEYERALDAIIELDNDWAMGKVPKEIYRSQRQQLVTKGTAALKKIEQESKKRKTPNHPKLSDLKLDALIIARRKSRKK